MTTVLEYRTIKTADRYIDIYIYILSAKGTHLHTIYGYLIKSHFEKYF